MPVLKIPFGRSQHEDVDPRVASDGVLRSVKELVTDRRGRFVKRLEYDTLTTGDADGPIWALNEFNGARLIAYDQPPVLSLHDAAKDIVTESTVQQLPAFTAPQRYPIPHELGDGANELTQTDVAHVNGWTVVLWVLSDVARLGWYNEATGALVVVSVPYAIDSATAKLCVAGDYVVLVYPTASTTLSARVWDSTSSGAPVMSGAWPVLTVVDTEGFALSAYRGTNFFLVAGVTEATTDIEADIAVWDPADVAALGAAEDTVAGLTVLASEAGSAALAIDGNLGDGVLFAFRYAGSSSDGLAYYHLDDALDTNLGRTAIVSGDTYVQEPSLLQLADDTWMVMSGNVSTTTFDVSQVITWTVSTAGVVGPLRRHMDVRPVSRLFGILEPDGAVRPFCVAVSDRDTASTGGTAFTQNYYILALRPVDSFNEFDSLRVHGFFGRDVALAPNGASYQLANVVQTSDGTWLFCGQMLAQGTALDRDTFEESVRLGAALWRFSSESRERFGMVKLGAGGYMPGGIMTRWNGAVATEAGFLRRPDIISLTSSTNGNLTQGGEYSYVAVYESIANDGEIVRSEPSTVATVTLTGSDDDVTVRVRDNTLRSNHAMASVPEAKIYLYRTKANTPGVYYMVMDQDDPIVGDAVSDGAASTTYLDTIADTVLETHQQLYSDGAADQPLVNVVPPPCKVLARVGKRLAAAGVEIPEEGWLSKEAVPGEQVAWANSTAFKVVLPEPVVTVGELDGYPVWFTRHTVHVSLGVGPDDLGNGAFELRQIPTEFGAVSHHVATTDDGLVYQSRRGIELLRRGFGAPEWIGAPVADTLGSALITSAVVCERDKTVRFTFSGGVLVYNTTWKVWSVFELGSLFAASTWDGYHVVAMEDFDEATPIREESSGTPTTYIDGTIVTADLTMGELAGYARLHEVIALVEYRGQARVSLEVSYDAGQNWSTPITYDLSSATFAAGAVVPLELPLRYQKNDRFRFRLTDEGYEGGTTGTDGVRFLGLTLDWAKKQRPLRPVRAGLRG